MSADGGIPLPKAFKSELFPLDRLDPGGDIVEFLSNILVTSFEETVFDPGPGGSFVVGLTVAEERVINLIGLDGFAVVLGGASATSLTLGVEMRPDSLLVKLGAGARLRFPRNVLKPVVLEGTEWVDDPSRAYAEIAIAAGVIIDQDWNVAFDGANAFTLQPAMVADSGFVIEGNVALDLSESTGLPESTAIGLPPSWRGVVFRSLIVHLPPTISESVPIASVAFENFHIGSGGVSGRIRLNGAPASGKLAGFPFTPTAFEIELKQNALVGIDLAGTLTLPFFDAPVSVEAGFDLQGNLTVGLASADGSGLVSVDKPGLLAMTLDSLTFAREGGVFSAALGGGITLDVGGLDWPTVGVQALIIDSTGDVRIEGGWIDLQEQYVLDLHGFQFSLSRIGFGTEVDGSRWIGFNGGLKLVDGLTAGASVEGMRVHWSTSGPPNPRLSLDGVGVEFEIPGTLSFRGFVAMRELNGGFRFDGNITLELTTLELSIDGQLVVGYNGDQDFTYFAIYLGVELPVGIPLWTTGLGLYGLAGLFALNMEPGRAPDEPWYDIPPAPDWYHKNPPGVGVAELRKWNDANGSLALGAGITIGTVADNGFTFAGKLLLAIVFPGPILLLEGRANVLKQRASLDDEPIFRALMVIDGREGTITAGLDARYAIADNGELIDLHGSLEVFFDFNDLQAWHLYLGIDEPRERRIGADIFFRIFHTDSYFMVDARRVRTGAWTGIEKHWSFGPLSVDLEAWLDGKADLSFKPAYFQGALAVHGGFGVSVFGFGFHFRVGAALAAGVFDPFYIKADFHVSVGLPWPLPDFDVDFSLEWGPEANPPLLPATIKEVGLGHDLVSTTWELPAGTLLLPAHDAGSPQAEFFAGQPPALPDPDMPPPAAHLIPVVPVDARPEITFGRSVHDDALVGVNAQPQYLSASPPGWSRIGDPARNEGPVLIRPSLSEVRLDRWTGGSWVGVARAGQAPDPSVPARLYGSWMPVPAESGATGPGQTKLRLWAKTPFSYTRRSSANWTDAFLSLYPNYPCIDVPKDRRACCDFTGYAAGTRLTPPWSCPNNDLFVITWTAPPAPVVHGSDGTAGHETGTHCLRFPPGGVAIVVPTRELKRLIVEADATRVEHDEDGTCVDFTDRPKGRDANPRIEQGHTFQVFAGGGSPAAVTEIASAVMPDGTQVSGLACGVQLNCTLATSAFAVTLTLSSRMPRTTVAAFDAAGKRVGEESVDGRVGLVEMRFAAVKQPITRIVIVAFEPSTTLLHRLCPQRAPACEVTVDIYDAAGKPLARVPLKEGRVEVDGRGASRFVISAGDCGFCLTRVCAIAGLSPSDQAQLGSIAAHTIEELARWQTDGDVLPPYSTFRLRLRSVVDVQVPAGSKAPGGFAGARPITQVAYFRTEGPPGLAALTRSGDALVPGAGAAGNPPAMETGLEDLRRYIVQTVPATVAPQGQPPRLTRPVYRGYDVGVAFGTNYVDLMYALAGRDLSLMLYDMNDQPVRDAQGRLLVRPNGWGRTDALTLTESEQQWLEVVDTARCTSGLIDLGTVARNKVISAGGFVLDAETIYEARLVPLLVAESFDNYPLGAVASGTAALLAGTGPLSWRVLDVGSAGAPSRWRIAESGVPADRYVEQTSSIFGGTPVRDAAFPGGSLLQFADTASLPSGDPDQPSQWTDYRLSVVVRSSDDGIIGIGVRMSGRRGYLLTLDRHLDRCRLVRVGSTTAAVLAEASSGFALNTDVSLTFEAVQTRLRVHIDGKPVFDVANIAWSMGTIGLYTADNSGARFTDVRVDDLRATAPVVYRFKFTTSAFADFRHHLGSGSDRAIAVPLDDSASIAAAAGAAIDPAGSAAGAAALEAEARAYDAIAAAALGAAARQRAVRAEAMRLTSGGQTAALLVRTAEPIDWSRTRLTVSAAVDTIPSPVPASAAKLTSLGFSTGAVPAPLAETATVLLLEERDLSGHAIERRTLPSPGAPALADGTRLWNGDFIATHQIGDSVPSELWAPAFQDLSQLIFITPAGTGAPDWQATAGVLRQDALFLTPDASVPGLHIERKSTGALAIGPPLVDGGDVRIAVHLELAAGGAAGVVFRFVDAQNYYRYAIDRQRGRRILSKVAGGVFSVLASSSLASGLAAYDLAIEAVGSRIVVRVNGLLVASVADPSHTSGRVGFYTQRKPNARFGPVRVQHISRRLGDWRIDDVSAAGDRGVWEIAHGVLLRAPQPASPGLSFAVIANGAWADLRLATVLIPDASAAGETGLVWRYSSPQEHVRFVLDTSGLSAQVIARRSGLDHVLWAGVLPAGGPARQVAIEAIGRRLIVTVDAQPLIDLVDAGLGLGTIGAFADRVAGLQMAPPDIRHAAPTFEPWYVFAAEPRQVAGRRLHVCSSAEPAGYVSPAGEKARWRGIASSGFQPSFPAEGIDARLIDQTGAVLHQRRFRPPSAYAALPARIVRAADGTGLAVLPPGSGMLPAGELVLDWEFRRDNTAVETTALTLRQEGEAADETVSLCVV